MENIMEVEYDPPIARQKDSDIDANLRKLIDECTCPECRKLMDQPQILRCTHSLCKRCLSLKRRQKLPTGSFLCPVCNEKSDANHHAQPDLTTQTLLQVLQQIKGNLCQEADCWKIPSTSCPGCCVARCQDHHSSCIKNLHSLCTNACAQAEEFVDTFSNDSRTDSFSIAETSLDSLGHELKGALELKIKECKHQLGQYKSLLLEEQIKIMPIVDQMKTKIYELKVLQATDNYAGMQSAQDQLRRLLADAKRAHPPMELAPPPPASECLSDLAGVLARIRVDTVVQPYATGSEAASLRRCLRTETLQPWDLALLTNLDGVFLTEDASIAVGLKPSGGRPVPAPGLLIVNFKGFPTKRLHAYDCEGDEAATIRLEMKSGEMPGKFAVCNRRQLILATEPTKHCVFVFSLAGALLKRFGSRGAEPGCFNEPIGLFPCEQHLYVVDSENKRVQLFDMAADFAYMDQLAHPQFTGHVHSVHVGAEFVIVSDRERKRLFTFDRGTKRPLLDVSLPGQPFDLVADEFGNVMVSVTDERTVRVLNHSLAVPVCTVGVPRSHAAGTKAAVAPGAKAPAVVSAAGSSGDSCSDDAAEPLRRLLRAGRRGGVGGKRVQVHGVAYLPGLRRLFVADTFRCAVLLLDLAD